jgi:deoxyhypusine synthase
MSELKTQLKEIIQNNVVTVFFTKVDGTEREMKCTLMAEYLPDQYQNNNTQLLQESLGRLENVNTLSVWDLDANSWRSFRCDSVTRIEKV